MYTKIMIPLDGSRCSEMILPYARRLARSMGLSVELFHAIDQKSVVEYIDPAHGRYMETVETELQQRAQQYLHTTAAEQLTELTVECSVDLGLPENAIVTRAEQRNGTLIAMATRGHSGIKRWFLGSVADKVLQATKNPLLLVKAIGNERISHEGKIRSLLVPVDGSELAECILPHAAAVAKAMNLPIELIRAYSLFIGAAVHPPYDVGSLPLSADDRIVESVKKEAEEYLAIKESQLHAWGINKVARFSILADAAEQIIETAQKTPLSLIVMSTHGRSGIGRWVLGSVAGRVIRQSGEPVLVVRPENAS